MDLKDVSHRRLFSGEHLVTKFALLGVAQAAEKTFLHLNAGDNGSGLGFKVPLDISCNVKHI